MGTGITLRDLDGAGVIAVPNAGDDTSSAFCPVCHADGCWVEVAYAADGTVAEFRSARHDDRELRRAFARLVAHNNNNNNHGNDNSASSSTWSMVDLGPILAGDHAPQHPTIMARTDGQALLYAGKLHSIYGEPEAGKGWLALQACAEQLSAGLTVLYVDFEDEPATIITRLTDLGVERDAIAEQFAYIRPDEALTAEADRELEAALARQPVLVVIDGVTEAMTLQGLELGGNTETAQWRALLPRRVAATTGAAVVEIDHVVKDREARGRGPIGAQHKLAGLDVAYKIEVIEPLARGRTGVVKVIVEKDRHGHVRALSEAKAVAEMHVISNEDGVTVEVRPPAGDAGEAWRPTHLMEKVSRAVETSPGISKRGIRGSVSGKAQFVEQALAALVEGGFVHTQAGPRGAIEHYSTKPYREGSEADRVPRVPTVSQRGPDTVDASVSRVPPPQGDTDTLDATEDELAEVDRVLEKFGGGRS